MKPVVSIGNQDFKSIRENQCFYVDKTDFIREWWENQDAVTLITRPRRFGKTLNMSMVEQFFSNQYEGCGSLFDGLEILKNEKYRQMQGTYPVIFLSFAAVKGDNFAAAREGILQLLVKLYGKYSFLQNWGGLSEQDREYFDSVKLTMTDTTAAFALYSLSGYLNSYYGKKVLILLDEYDTPLQEAYVNGYWNELVSFMRSLFNAAFKTNPFLERGLLTGITRVSKESIFSDLNNLEVITTTSDKYKTSFGFTEDEVSKALQDFGLAEHMDKVKAWYDGFRFGDRSDIYNPWSITKYLDTGKFGSYWANTSSNRLVGKLIQEGSPEIKIAVEDLMDGKQIEAAVDEEIVFEQLGQSDTAVWSLLLACGYLRVEHVPEDGELDGYLLALTNLEVKKMFRNMILGWFQNPALRYNDFIKALLSDDTDYMNQYMNQIALRTFSFFDTGKISAGQSEPERFYHGFVLGLMVDLARDYRITSNRESGLGRYDIMLEPLKKGAPAFVIEFKVYRPEKEADLQETVQNALQQIVLKKYDEELTARGISKDQIRHYGFAFEGKRVLIG